jgi:hypothetical protein
MGILEVFSSQGRRSYVKAPGERKWIQLQPGQHVRIEARNEEFIVLRVDEKRHAADLLPAGTMSKVEMGVPIGTISPVGEPPPPEHDWPEVA